MSTALSSVVRTVVAVAVVVAAVARADAQTLKPLYQYRYGDSADFLYTTDFYELGYGGNGWTYLGATMQIYDSQASGTVPLYRFYHSQYGKHLSATDFVSNSDPSWQYEGVTGYVYPTAQSGTSAVYRWFKWVSGGPSHFFMFYNETEFNYNYSAGWQLDGISFYAAACTDYSTCYLAP